MAALEEDAERAAARLIAATRDPVIVNLEVHGAAVEARARRTLADLMAGAPALLGLSLRPEGGELIVRGRTPGGVWEERLETPPTEAGAGSPAITAFYGREAVEDLELDLAAGADGKKIDGAIETIGLEFGLATRLTSWVAISEEPSVDPRLPVRRVTVPQELPYGMSAEGLGLRASPGLFHAVSLVGQTFMAMGVDGLTDEELLRRMPSAMLPAQRATSKRALSGRWVGGAEKGGKVLEIEVTDATLDWRPVRRATLRLRDGRRIKVSVILSATTAPGLIEPGHLVRLALQLKASDQPDLQWIEVVCGETLVVIVL